MFIPGNASAGGSAVCIHRNVLPDDALVTKSRPVVNVRSGCRSLVVVNPELARETMSHHPTLASIS